MHPRLLRRLLPAFAVAGTLFLSGTVQALPLSGSAGRAAARREAGWDGKTLLSWLGQTFASLWAEEGGSPIPASPDPLDGGPEGDTGKLIDPNG